MEYLSPISSKMLRILILVMFFFFQEKSLYKLTLHELFLSTVTHKLITTLHSHAALITDETCGSIGCGNVLIWVLARTGGGGARDATEPESPRTLRQWRRHGRPRSTMSMPSCTCANVRTSLEQLGRLRSLTTLNFTLSHFTRNQCDRLKIITDPC